ncbi:MAG TPA: hypothetical protein VMV49_13130 [Candidatus Deferrimicrobium sp.]|nr:hypothetical protein [Candidatus Deferrimicrobium sp.]
MSRQRKLFQVEEKKEKQKEIRRKALEATKEEKRKEREIEREEEKQKKTNRKPKNEFYQCECGILLHWRVAYGHRSGCPQCHKPIPLSDIFI